MQYLLISLHRLKLVLPWKLGAKVKYDWKMSHCTLLEHFTKSVANVRKLWLTFLGVYLSLLPFLSRHSPKKQKSIFCMSASITWIELLQFLFRKKKISSNIRLLVSWRAERKKHKAKQNQENEFPYFWCTLFKMGYFSVRDKVLPRTYFPFPQVPRSNNNKT